MKRNTTVTIPNNVITIGEAAFSCCSNLTSVYFKGNAPSLGGSDVFYYATNATVYYLLGTTGWGPLFGSRATALWYLPTPVILTLPPYFGVQTSEFGFRVSWATNASVAVEASTNPSDSVWSPVSTNTLAIGIDRLTDGWFYFSDPDWTNHPARFYRLRSP